MVCNLSLCNPRPLLVSCLRSFFVDLPKSTSPPPTTFTTLYQYHPRERECIGLDHTDDFLFSTNQNRGINYVDSILELPMAWLRGRPYSSVFLVDTRSGRELGNILFCEYARTNGQKNTNKEYSHFLALYKALVVR